MFLNKILGNISYIPYSVCSQLATLLLEGEPCRRLSTQLWWKQQEWCFEHMLHVK